MTRAGVDAQLARIRRGAVDLVGAGDLGDRLEESARSGRPLRVKLGIDPSSPDIHLGHTVVLRKLAAFQELGHQAVLIWGTATAMVGDPTGKDKTRPQLTREQVRANLATYREQIRRVLDVDAAEHHENGTWFDRMRFDRVIALLSRTTVARALERDSFEKRMKAGEPVGMHELVYPLMQGWDSVEVRADVEIGGSDQLFNLLVGRDLQEQEGQRRQVCLTMPILEGLDGVKKMSKSLRNAIGIDDEPADMFGKVMSLPDGLMERYFVLLTERSDAERAALLGGHPRAAKAALGEAIVGWLHGEEAAKRASAEFDRVFKERALPSEIPECELAASLLRAGRVQVATVAAKAELCASASAARRLMPEGGLRVDGAAVTDPRADLGPGSYLVQVGKRRVCRVVIPG